MKILEPLPVTLPARHAPKQTEYEFYHVFLFYVAWQFQPNGRPTSSFFCRYVVAIAVEASLKTEILLS